MTGAIGDAPHHPAACGCDACRTRLQAECDAMGEQAPDADEVLIHALRQEVAVLREECAGLERQLRDAKARAR